MGKIKGSQKAFEQRTAGQFSEFQELFQTCLARAKISAAKCQARDREKFRSRSYEWILESCLGSRLSTLVNKPRWSDCPVSQWLLRLGLSEAQITAIFEAASGKIERKIWGKIKEEPGN